MVQQTQKVLTLLILFTGLATAPGSLKADPFTDLKVLALKGESAAQVGLADLIAVGKAPVRDTWQALVLYTLAAHAGHPQAAGKAAELSKQSGVKLEEDLAQALAFSDTDSMRTLLKTAYHYDFNPNLGDRIPGRAILLYEIAAGQGDPHGKFLLGTVHIRKSIALRDHPKAARLFERAAELGVAPAAFNLGWIFEKGMLGISDYAAAREAYEKAAQQDLAQAHYRLGVMAVNGLGGKPNPKAALAHFRKAAQASTGDTKIAKGLRAAAAKNAQRLELIQQIASQYPDGETSDEGFLFNNQGAANPLPVQASKLVGTHAALLEECETRQVANAFQIQVRQYLKDARDDAAKAEINARIRVAFNQTLSRLKTLSRSDVCLTPRKLQAQTSTVLTLMQYDWGFKSHTGDEPLWFTVGPREFLVFKKPKHENPDSRFAGPIDILDLDAPN